MITQYFIPVGELLLYFLLDHVLRLMRFSKLEQNLVYILLNRYTTNVTKTKATKAKMRASVNLMRCFFDSMLCIISSAVGHLSPHFGQVGSSYGQSLPHAGHWTCKDIRHPYHHLPLQKRGMWRSACKWRIYILVGLHTWSFLTESYWSYTFPVNREGRRLGRCLCPSLIWKLGRR